MADLYQFVFDTQNRLPFLSRDLTKNISTTDIQASGTTIYSKIGSGKPFDNINVVEDFPWTKSPKTSRSDVPEIELVEKRIINSSSLANFFYTILAGGDVGEVALNRLSENGGKVQVGQTTVDVYNIIGDAAASVGEGVGNFADQLQQDEGKVQQLLGDFLDSSSEAISNTFDILADSTKKGLESFTDSFKSVSDQAKKFIGSETFENYLESYEGLYLTENTGFRYLLPYLNNDYLKSENVMTSTGFFGESIQELVGGIGDLLLIDRPGTYIEQSKQVSLGENGRTLNVTFPLLNTTNYEDISRNWQLLFALIYQNKHGRVNRSLIEVPCIYEVFMEGVAYMPYGYISGITVDFLGSRRKMKIRVPKMQVGDSGSSKISIRDEIETVIPDAYNVNLTITGLNPESRNFMMRSLGNPVVEASTKGS